MNDAEKKQSDQLLFRWSIVGIVGGALVLHFILPAALTEFQSEGISNPESGIWYLLLLGGACLIEFESLCVFVPALWNRYVRK